ncbi:MAG: hypothetical protein EOO45_00460 [Flavobacterium sp.]|nr:MAG: hypothetical protein EOO45_00460 [Flavobacterium sp.]
MKKKQNQQIITDTEVVFEMDNNGFQSGNEDPTTSLATTTLTHIFTRRDVPHVQQKKVRGKVD